MKKIISLILVLLMIMGLCSFSVGAESFEDELSEQFLEYCLRIKSTSDPDAKVFITRYFVSDDIEFFAGRCSWIYTENWVIPDIYGDWVVNTSGTPLSKHGIFVRIDGEIYALEDAWELGLITDLSPMVENNCSTTRIGDANYDKKLNIKDATLIQKYLAGTVGNPLHTDFRLVFDKNKDKDINIKDATAIQKRLADIPE